MWPIMKKGKLLIVLTVLISGLILSSCVFYEGGRNNPSPYGVYIRLDKDTQIPYKNDTYRLYDTGEFISENDSSEIYYLSSDGYVRKRTYEGTGIETLGKWEWNENGRVLNFRREFYFKKL